MPRPPLKKAEIDEAAIRLFATVGLTATKVKHIAAAAGVTEGALYRYYAGKDDMAWRLYCREVSVFVSRFDALLSAATGPFASRLKEAVRFIYRYYANSPDRLVYVLFARQSFPQRHLIDEHTNPDQVLARFIQREIEAGNISAADPLLLLAMLRGVVLQPILMHRYGVLPKPPLEYVDQVAAACATILTRTHD